MVGIVKDIVIPLKGGTDPVFTIVCEILTTPALAYPSEEDDDRQQNPHVTRLWKMASAWRVISFFLVVFVLPTVLISLPLYARYHLYHARHLPMTETDTRALNHAVSSFWCQGQRVTSNGTLDAFKVAGTPRVQKQRRHVELRRNLTLRHDDIEYWGVYLLEGSTVSLSSVARWPGGTLLVVQGEGNLRKCFYREDRVQDQLAETRSAIPKNRYKGIPDEEEHRDLNPKNLDTEEEDGGLGGEVFDNGDYFASKTIGQELEHQDDPDQAVGDSDDKLVPMDLEQLGSHKYAGILEKKPKTKQRGGKKKNKKGRKKKDREGRKERHDRTRRSRLLERIRRDVPSVPVPEMSDATVSDKLNFLHKFNDTLDVTTGNSSISSSEEFLEQCKDTILTIDLTPYIDWHEVVSDLSSNNPDAWKFNANSTDYYYFIFTSDNNIEINHVGFNLQLERATYDVSSPLETCRNSSECIFPLAFAQTESVVVEVPGQENLNELHSFEVTTTCQPRVPVYMVFILLVPFIILLFAFQ